MGKIFNYIFIIALTVVLINFNYADNEMLNLASENLVMLNSVKTNGTENLLNENFDYPSGDSLGAHGWAYLSGGSTNVLAVTSPGLIYSGYPLSGIGNATTIATSGQDACKNFSQNDSTGNIYVSFMIKVTSAQTAGDYFFALLPPSSTTLYTARFFAKDSSGELAFGLSKSTASAGGIFYTGGTYSYGTTYLVVIKYQFNPSTADDVMSAFIFATVVPTTEPGAATIGPVSGTAGDNALGRIAIRQGSAFNAAVATLDGIKVTKFWSDILNLPSVALNSPPINSMNNSLTVDFIWTGWNSIKYILQVSSDSLFNNVIINDTINIDTFKTVNGFSLNTKYFWRVMALNAGGSYSFSTIWNFTTSSGITLNLKLIPEGVYFFLFNQLSRRDTFTVYLRNTVIPYSKVDSSKAVIDSMNFTGAFTFPNAPSGTYYIATKHLNSIETWSTAGGEPMTINGTTNYDFTSAAVKAFGNNLKLKGSKYCIYSGDINQDGIIDASDLIKVYNDSYVGLTGRFIVSDLNGDSIVDASDISVADNNVFTGILKIIP